MEYKVIELWRLDSFENEMIDNVSIKSHLSMLSVSQENEEGK